MAGENIRISLSVNGSKLYLKRRIGKMCLELEGFITLITLIALVITGFVRTEHRLTRTETLLKVVLEKIKLCQQASDKDSG